MWVKLLTWGTLAGIAVLGLGTRRTLALEPPLSERELRDRSDLIVEADVLGVVLTTIECNARWEYRDYRAWLLVCSTHKGPLTPNSTLEVVWRDRQWRSSEPEPAQRSFEPAFYPGDRVRACLTWSDSRYGWRTVQWNALDVLEQSGKSLPRHVGQVVFAGEIET